MKVYIAAPYSRKDDMNVYAAELRAAGFTITSSWLDETYPPNIQTDDVSPEENKKFATQDMNDICESDMMIFFTDDTHSIVRGGRHVEFGLALAYKKEILVVGTEYENVFHYLPEVWRADNWVLAKSFLSAPHVWTVTNPQAVQK